MGRFGGISRINTLCKSTWTVYLSLRVEGEKLPFTRNRLNKRGVLGSLWKFENFLRICLAITLYPLNFHLVTFSSLKLVYIFSVNPHLGPLQVSLSRMVMDIMKFIFLYVLVLFAFSCGKFYLFIESVSICSLFLLLIFIPSTF